MSDTSTQDTTASGTDTTSGDQQQPASGTTDTGVKTGGSGAAKQPPATGNQDSGGSRDAATDQGGEPDSKRSGDGDGTRALKALEKEREARKAADQSVKDLQAQVAAAQQKQQDQLNELGKALGFTKDDAPKDPEALQREIAERDRKVQQVEADRDQQLQSRDDTIRQQRVELAAWRLGSDPKLGANVAALLDSRRVTESTKAMDPDGESFEKDLFAVLETAVKGNEAYRINRAAAAADAGIGATGAKTNDAQVTPGTGRLRAAYGAT